MASEIRRFIGIDLGKRTYEIKIINPDGKVTGWSGKTTKAGRNELYSRLHENDRIAIEVCILNAGQLPIIYKSTKKNDKEDALKLARLMKTHDNSELPLVSPPTKQEIYQRKLLSEYKQLKQQRTQLINRLHAVFVSCGITDIYKKDLSTNKSREKTLMILKDYDLAQGERINSLLQLIDNQIADVEKLIDECTVKDENIEKLQTIPGVGKITAIAFSSYIGDGSRFNNVSQVSNYIGLVPKIDISCTIQKYGGISRLGNKYLRSLLVLSSWTLVRSRTRSSLQDKYVEMTQIKGKSKKKAIVAIARKLAELMYTVIKTGESFKYIPNRTVTLELANKALA